MTTPLSVTTASWNQSVLRQFPWISSAVDIARLTERIKIGLVDERVLSLTPSSEDGTELSNWWTDDKITFRDLGGNILATVKTKTSGPEPVDYQEGETVLDALSSLAGEVVDGDDSFPNLSKIDTICRYQYESSSAVSHNSASATFIIYKVGRFNLAGTVRLFRHQADQAVYATLGPDNYNPDLPTSQPHLIDDAHSYIVRRNPTPEEWGNVTLHKAGDSSSFTWALVSVSELPTYSRLLERHSLGDVHSPDGRSWHNRGLVQVAGLELLLRHGMQISFPLTSVDLRVVDADEIQAGE